MNRVIIAIVGASIVATASPQALEPRQAVFSARASTVRVDVLVTENGRAVTGLKSTDFEVLDNGVAQDISLLSGEDLPLSLVLALDMSDSVEGDRREHLRQAGHALLDALRPDDRAGLLTFDHKVDLRIPLTTDRQLTRDGLDRMRIAGGGTALVDAAFAGLVLADAEIGRALLMVFSDDIETSSWLESSDVLNSARASNVTVYSVIVEAPASGEFLRDLSGGTGGRVIRVDSTANLTSAFVAALEEYRHRYLLGFTPRNVAAAGWHKLDVRVKRRNATVTARRGYQAGT
jgi:VWFA-related protein